MSAKSILKSLVSLSFVLFASLGAETQSVSAPAAGGEGVKLAPKAEDNRLKLDLFAPPPCRSVEYEKDMTMETFSPRPVESVFHNLESLEKSLNQNDWQQPKVYHLSNGAPIEFRSCDEMKRFDRNNDPLISRKEFSEYEDDKAVCELSSYVAHARAPRYSCMGRGVFANSDIEMAVSQLKVTLKLMNLNIEQVSFGKDFDFDFSVSGDSTLVKIFVIDRERNRRIEVARADFTPLFYTDLDGDGIEGLVHVVDYQARTMKGPRTGAMFVEFSRPSAGAPIFYMNVREL